MPYNKREKGKDICHTFTIKNERISSLWTSRSSRIMVITNIHRKWAKYSEILVLLRLRWQIERLFRLWKEDAKIDKYRTKKPHRILYEFYAKTCAMIIQQPFIQKGCWLDPFRSLVKAADSLRRECNRIMIAFYEGNLEKMVQSLLHTLQSRCRVERRAAYPSTAQLLLDGLDWQFELLLSARGSRRHCQC